MPDGEAPGFMPAQEAQEFCARRRWEPYVARAIRRKVYDMFLINTELDWLELRLQQMNDDVDYFIILESATTFQEGPKSLYLENSYDQFKDYHHKMIRQTLDLSKAQLPPGDAWEQERFMRNALFDQVLTSLTGDAAPELGDVILISDIDEIPRPSTMKALRNCAYPPRVTLRSAFYYYSFQWLHRGEQWAHPQATYYFGADGTVRPQTLRMDPPDAELFNAAWHCSSCHRSMEDLQNKITSFAHKHYNQEYFLQSERLLRHVRNGEDLFERESEVFDRIDNNPDVPDMLRNATNRGKFAYMLDRDPLDGNFVDL